MHTPVALLNNGVDYLELNSDGEFKFTSPLKALSLYEVHIDKQPKGQNCTISHNTGIISSADITDIVIQCIKLSGSLDYSFGGDVNSQDGIPDGFVVKSNTAGVNGHLAI